MMHYIYGHCSVGEAVNEASATGVGDMACSVCGGTPHGRHVGESIPLDWRALARG